MKRVASLMASIPIHPDDSAAASPFGRTPPGPGGPWRDLGQGVPEGRRRRVHGGVEADETLRLAEQPRGLHPGDCRPDPPRRVGGDRTRAGGAAAGADKGACSRG